MAKGQHVARHTTGVGTEVEVTYEWVDDERVRVVHYRRRPKGGINFQHVASEEGTVVLKDQLPFLRGVTREGGTA